MEIKFLNGGLWRILTSQSKNFGDCREDYVERIVLIILNQKKEYVER